MMMTVVGRKWTTTKSHLLGLCCSDASFSPWHSCNILDTSSCSVALHYSLPIDLSVLPKFAFTLTLPSHSLHTSVLPFHIFSSSCLLSSAILLHYVVSIPHQDQSPQLFNGLISIELARFAKTWCLLAKLILRKLNHILESKCYCCLRINVASARSSYNK